MVDFCRVLEISNEICDNVTYKGEHIHARCPICGDSARARKKRLHIDWYQTYQEWVATCYNGGCPMRSANIYSLYAQATGMGYTEAKRYINNDKYDTDKIKIKLKPIKKSIDKHVKCHQEFDIDTKNECITLNDEPEGRIQERLQDALRDFITTRCIPSSVPLCVAHSGKYKGRIIIPLIIREEMVYFQGRSIIDVVDTKYLNPEVDKEMLIMNSDNFSRDKYIILTEGLIDAYMVDYNQGCPFLGSFVNDDFITKLLNYTDKGIIIAWDNPLIDKAGKDEIIKFIDESKYSKNVEYFLPTRKDFKDLNDLKILEPDLNIYNYVIKNSYSHINITVKLKLK